MENLKAGELGLSRRNFLKGTLVVGAACAATGLVACGPTGESEEGEEVQLPAEYADGKYVTRAMGLDNYVNVLTVFKDKKITECSVLSNDELNGVGSYAIERIPPLVVEKQSINIDAVSGATWSSKAILAAVTTAIESAGLNVADFSAVDEAVEPEKTSQDASADVVIMGAGNAGLITALRLLEKGRSVIVFEKRDIPGGAMPMTYGGLAGYASDLQKAYSLGGDTYKEDIIAEELVRLESRVVPEYAREDGIPYTTAMTLTGGPLIDWFHNMGVGFMTASTTLAPGMYMGGVGDTMLFIVNRIVALGGQIIYGTPVTELIKEGDRITGVVAEGSDGITWNVSAKAVMLASGGFGGNKDLMAEYYPDYADFFINTHTGSTGDGLVLGLDAGAGVECMGRFLGAFLSAYSDKFELAFLHSTSPGIMVNQNGDNIGDITYPNHTRMSEAASNPEHTDFYYVMDDASAEMTRKSELFGFDTYKGMFEKSDMYHFDSVEEAMEELSLPSLKDVIESNNACSLAGEPEFNRENLPYIDIREGVWLMHVDPTVYMTTGGLKIDVDARVLTDDDTVIEGLYAAGDVCGSIEEKDGAGYNHGFFASMTYGYRAAETMDAEI